MFHLNSNKRSYNPDYSLERPLGNQKLKWEDNIKMELRELYCDDGSLRDVLLLGSSDWLWYYSFFFLLAPFKAIANSVHDRGHSPVARN
jgi:hypothetical protein